MSNRKQELIQQLAALEELDRRRKNARPSYTPNEGQLLIHSSTAKERFCFGGNSGGKTTALVHEIKWYCLDGYNPYNKQYNEVPNHSYLVLDHPTKVEGTIKPEFRKWFDTSKFKWLRKGKPTDCELVFPNGSVLTILFWDQDLMVGEGINISGRVFADEPMPRGWYIALSRGLRDKKSGGMLLVGTPLQAPWLRKDVYEKWKNGERPDTDCIRFDSIVNKDNWKEGFYESFVGKLSEAEKKVRLQGHFFDGGASALGHLFSEETHVIDPFDWPVDKAVVVSVDMHPNKNHIACMVGSDGKGQLYYIKELSSKLPPRQYARQLKQWMEGFKVIDIIGDSLGETRQTGGDGNMSFNEVLRSEGVRIRATTFSEKSDEDFITRLQDVLSIDKDADNFGRKIPKLQIFRGNNGIVDDIQQCEWQKVRGEIGEYKPKLEISNRDYLATLKYALSTGISFRTGEAKVIKTANPIPWGKTTPNDSNSRWLYNLNRGLRRRRR